MTKTTREEAIKSGRNGLYFLEHIREETNILISETESIMNKIRNLPVHSVIDGDLETEVLAFEFKVNAFLESMK